MSRVAGTALVGFVIAITAQVHAEPQSSARVRTSGTISVRATAYCQAGKTQSGVMARDGIVAADPNVLPVGSVVHVIDGPSSGIYTVMDTGPAVKGRKIDIFIADCARAKRFGSRTVHVRVMRHGWDPKATPSPTSPDGR